MVQSLSYSYSMSLMDREKFERKPPGKRPNYYRMAFDHPFQPSWTSLLGLPPTSLEIPQLALHGPDRVKKVKKSTSSTAASSSKKATIEESPTTSTDATESKESKEVVTTTQTAITTEVLMVNSATEKKKQKNRGRKHKERAILRRAAHAERVANGTVVIPPSPPAVVAATSTTTVVSTTTTIVTPTATTSTENKRGSKRSAPSTSTPTTTKDRPSTTDDASTTSSGRTVKRARLISHLDATTSCAITIEGHTDDGKSTTKLEAIVPAKILCAPLPFYVLRDWRTALHAPVQVPTSSPTSSSSSSSSFPFLLAPSPSSTTRRRHAHRNGNDDGTGHDWFTRHGFSLSNLSHVDYANALLRVSVRMSWQGTPVEGAVICLPTDDDIQGILTQGKKWRGAIEPVRRGHIVTPRPLLEAKRAAAGFKPYLTASTSDDDSKTSKKKEAPSPSRDLIGYLTCGPGFSYVRGRGHAFGFVGARQMLRLATTTPILPSLTSTSNDSDDTSSAPLRTDPLFHGAPSSRAVNTPAAASIPVLITVPSPIASPTSSTTSTNSLITTPVATATSFAAATATSTATNATTMMGSKDGRPVRAPKPLAITLRERGLFIVLVRNPTATVYAPGFLSLV
jgi:hypothetical protein